jgi:hypothetical protein
MSMSTHIVGLRDPDSEHHQKMLAAVKAIEKAGLKFEEIEELADYFGHDHPSSDPMAGCTVDIDGCIEPDSRDSQNDWIVDLSTLPDGVTHIRFTNSY